MNALDRLIGAFAPERALKREMARQRLGLMSTFSTIGAYGPTSHDGASATKRGLRNWWPWSLRNPDEETLIDRQVLVARSRDAYRNQPVARGAIETSLTSVIGEGLALHCRVDQKFLGLSDDEAAAWEQNTQRLFNAWASSTDADVRRTNTFNSLQRTAFRSALHTGEVFTLLPLVPRKNTICPLRVQLVEADRISTPIGMINGPIIDPSTGKVTGSLWDGKETGKWGEPVAYHVETTVPSPFFEVERTWERILAFGTSTGFQQVIHLYEEERAGQRRGMPFLSPILEHLKDLTRYSEAELRAAVLSAMFTVFIKHDGDTDGDPLSGLTGTQPQSSREPETMELQSGAIIDLMKGEDIEIANPARPNSQFGPFTMEIIQQIGMALNIPHEVLVKRFSSSYSASRAAIIMAFEHFFVKRSWFVDQFLQPIYVKWLAYMIAAGRISAPGFFDDIETQRAYCGARWYGPSAPQIDPLKEANAAKARMDSLITTLAEETETMTGGNIYENLTQRKREKALIEEYGLGTATPVPTDQIPVFPE